MKGVLVTISPNIAKPYSSSTGYAKGEWVLRNNAYWTCKDGYQNGEPWTEDHWNREDDVLNAAIGGVKRSDFLDLEEKEGMTLKEVGALVNAILKKLKGTTVALVVTIMSFGFAHGANLSPDTDFGDISPTAKIGTVVSNAGAVMSETDPTVPAWAKQPNPPEGMTDNALVFTNGAVKTKSGTTITPGNIGAFPSENPNGDGSISWDSSSPGKISLGLGTYIMAGGNLFSSAIVDITSQLIMSGPSFDLPNGGVIRFHDRHTTTNQYETLDERIERLALKRDDDYYRLYCEDGFSELYLYGDDGENTSDVSMSSDGTTSSLNMSDASGSVSYCTDAIYFDNGVVRFPTNETEGTIATVEQLKGGLDGKLDNDLEVLKTNDNFKSAVAAVSPPVVLPEKWALANVTNAEGGVVSAADVGALSEEEDPYFTQFKSGTSVAIGRSSRVGGTGVSIGSNASSAGGIASVAIGTYATAGQNYSAAIGYGANASRPYSLAIGMGAVATNFAAVSIGAGTDEYIDEVVRSHGNGTFNIGAKSLDKVWLGETNLETLVKGAVPPVELPEKWALANVTNASGNAVGAADVHALPDTYTPPPETDPTVPAWAKQPNPPEGMPTTGLVWNATAGAVKTANGLKTIGAADVGALSTNGGFVAGNITIKDNTAIKFKTYEPDFDAEIRLGDAHSAMVLDALSYFYFNTKTTTGSEGIYFNGQKVALENWESLSKMLYNANANNLAINPAFSNAVLSVGLNIDADSVAVLNEIARMFGGFPITGTATTVGGLLAALAAAVAWLKKNKVGSFNSVGGASATVDNSVAKLDNFFTTSNSLLTGTIDARLPYPLYAVPSTGLLKDRAINTTSLASVTVPDNFTDLLIRASVASSLSVTMPEAIATKYGDTFPGESGEYLITITKTGAAEAYVRTIKLEVANA